MQQLYERAEKQLRRLSKPTQEFKVSTEDFIFSKKFEHLCGELETGKVISVGINKSAGVKKTDVTLKYNNGTTLKRQNYEPISNSSNKTEKIVWFLNDDGFSIANASVFTNEGIKVVNDDGR